MVFFCLLVCFVRVSGAHSEFGDKRKMILHYYLADDTVEINEVFAPNSGRDHPPNFLRRQKLPKVLPLLLFI